ncbi:Crotonobetainyl-CoA dehydrogenase [Alloiococcus otitis]|uniref:Acyl-CoA dehydrogenase n=1 Tax=Alloiococcus otitis ATCC 51267 TaxID=883081 RepID=K9ECA3_9LACT|nr:acyl-CoA dehydrogenase family protein [Alloiococcus otitis]EKU93436.1 hypothetical protein HMPREF9698_00968 [Alloiococcus otitis ATCC 51267]SUU81437.1 Crotonobetainyl-CoA dehydrogenase [Alloiococcus otitis]
MTELVDQASDFAKEYIEPIAQKLDEEKAFPEEVFEKLHEERYLQLLIPQEEGGIGGDIADLVDIIWTFAQKSATVGLTYLMHNVALDGVLKTAHEETRKRIIQEVIEEGKFLGLAYSETSGGVQFTKPDRTSAKKDGDHWILSGAKSMVTSATFANYYVVNATGPDEDEDPKHFLVSKDADGVTFKMEWWSGLGMRGNVSCPMFLEDVSISEADRLDNPQTHTIFLVGLAAVYSGLNTAIVDEAVMHTTDRQYPDGHKLSEVDAIKGHISTIYSNAQAATALTRQAAQAAREDLDAAFPQVLAARVVATENVTESANLGMRIGGGRAYTGFRNFELYLRDALAGQVMAPSLDMLKQWIGATITGQDID